MSSMLFFASVDSYEFMQTFGWPPFEGNLPIARAMVSHFRAFFNFPHCQTGFFGGDCLLFADGKAGVGAGF
jgi:hypothetical protein